MEDKLSNAHSLENRVPLMDNDLVDFAMQWPVSLKLNNLIEVLHLNENDSGSKQSLCFQKTNDCKQILRDVMAHYISSDITQAKKKGFSSPDDNWFKGDNIDFVKRTLLNENAQIYEFMDRETIKGLIAQHIDGGQNRRLLIWSLLNVEATMREVS